MRELRIVLTPFCNYKCFFCHSECLSDKVSLQLRPIDYGFMVKTVRDRLGWDTCTITGGEPLISPIFKEVSERINTLGVKITLITNGSLIARPKEILKDIHQINVSIHTMAPTIYEHITQVGYPLDSVLNTLVNIRVGLPELIIHLNYTVIKGLNDSVKEYEEILKFAKELKARVKFIDLSTTNKILETKAEEIVAQLEGIGFKVVDENAWQFRLKRDSEYVIVARCPFNGRYENLPKRDVFVDPNGTLYRSYGGYFAVNALNEIKAQDEDGLIEKIKVLLN